MSDKSYYAILGITQDAPSVVITAAYRALAKKFHPDITTLPADEAEARIREINEAFDVLSDPEKKSNYDKSLGVNSKSVSKSFDEDDGWEETDIKDPDWDIVEEHFPEIEDERLHLFSIAPELSARFQSLIITTKSYDDFKDWSAVIKDTFFETYFGSRRETRIFAEMLLTSGHRAIAQELNRNLRVLGEDNIGAIIEKVNLKYFGEIYGQSESEVKSWVEYFKSHFRGLSISGKEEWTKKYFLKFKEHLLFESGRCELDVVIQVEMGMYRKRKVNLVIFEIDLLSCVIRSRITNELFSDESEYESDEQAFNIFQIEIDRGLEALRSKY